MNVARAPVAGGAVGELPGASYSFQLSAEDKRTLARLFLETSHEDLLKLEHALQADDFDEVLHRVHRLHGAALTMGAMPLVGQLESFERTLHEARQIPADSHERLARLRRDLHDYQ
jgi:HPt (histidine-containing phosphotransfer) domain-containing protein